MQMVGNVARNTFCIGMIKLNIAVQAIEAYPSILHFI